MAAKRRDLESDDLKDAIAHVDQVSARITRLLADLADPKPGATPEAAGEGVGPADRS